VPTLEAAFDARGRDIEGAWRDYLRVISRPSSDAGHPSVPEWRFPRN
jgi:hypothetical protein